LRLSLHLNYWGCFEAKVKKIVFFERLLMNLKSLECSYFHSAKKFFLWEFFFQENFLSKIFGREDCENPELFWTLKWWSEKFFSIIFSQKFSLKIFRNIFSDKNEILKKDFFFTENFSKALNWTTLWKKSELIFALMKIAKNLFLNNFSKSLGIFS